MGWWGARRDQAEEADLPERTLLRDVPGHSTIEHDDVNGCLDYDQGGTLVGIEIISPLVLVRKVG